MRQRMVTVVAVLAVATLAACSSSKKSSSTVAAGASGTSAPSSSGSTTKSASGSSTNSPKYTWCDNGATNSLIAKMQANAATAGDPSTMQQDLALLRNYQSSAPAAIKADVATLVNFEAKFVGFLTADKGDPTKLATDMQGVQADEAQLQTASQHIQAWAAANCH